MYNQLDNCREQMKTISNFARWVLETGAAYVAGIVTKKSSLELAVVKYQLVFIKKES